MSSREPQYRIARPSLSGAVEHQGGGGFEVTVQDAIRAGDVIYSATEIAAGVALLGTPEPTMVTKAAGAILISKGSQSFVLNFAALVAGLSGSEKNATGFDFVEDITSYSGQGTFLAYATAQTVYGQPLPFSLSAALDVTEALGQGAWGFAKLNIQIPEAQAPTLSPQPNIARPSSSPSNRRASGANSDRGSRDISLDRPRPEPSGRDRSRPERSTQDRARPERGIDRPTSPPDRSRDSPKIERGPTIGPGRLG